MNETQIILGLRNNDRRVFEHLFDTFFPPVHFFANRLIKDSEEAKDIVSRALEAFWNIKDNFATLKNIQAFLYISTKNSCLNYLRSKERQEKNKAEYASHLLNLEDSKNIERKIIETEVLSDIYKHIEQLPKKRREIFKLTYFEGLKAAEIAERLNISKNTVTTQRQLAIQYLREVFKNENFLLICIIFNEGLLLTSNHT